MALAVVVAMMALVGQAPPIPITVAEELKQIEGQLAETYKTGQCDAWAALLAPEWSVIHITGTTITKDEAVATCRKPTAPIANMTTAIDTIRWYGDFAVVTGSTTAATSGANPISVTLRFTDVFVRRDGRWQIVASHATRDAP